MKPLLAVTAALALTAATAWTQPEPSRVITYPKVPSREALDRLSLTLNWSIRIKTEGAKDGLLSVQMIPDWGKQRLVVQTLRGDVILLDAETGDPLWITHIGRPYALGRPVAFNEQAVFATRRDKLFVLDRDTGKQLLYSIEKDSGLPLWGTTLEGVPSAGPAADDEMLFLCLGSRVSGYFVPDYRAIAKLRAREEGAEAARRLPSPQVRREWTKVIAPLDFDQPPLPTRDNLGVIATNGSLVSLTRLEGIERVRYQVEKAIAAPASQDGNFAYVGSLDFQLYAFDINGARLTWRFTGTAPIVEPVYSTDRDVYAAPDRVGLFRLNRATGAQRWLARNARRFLATNGKYLYAYDRFGNLLVLDHERGTQLARWDTREFTFPVSNDWTDRVYLAAHSGLIVCLHHRDTPSPLKIKTPPNDVTLKTPPKGKGGPKKVPPKKGGPKLGEMGDAAPRRAPDVARHAPQLRRERSSAVRRGPLLFRRDEGPAVEGPL